MKSKSVASDVDPYLVSEVSDYLRISPMSLVVRESCRLQAIKSVVLGVPEGSRILDVGCGDGTWWKLLLRERQFDVEGIDISSSEVEKASQVIKAHQVDITDQQQLQVLRSKYDFIIGNCSLEHIPDIDSAIKNIAQRLETSGKFVMFVPTPYWALKGHSVGLLHSISPRLSMAFSGLINGFFQHWHLYHHRLWSHILARNGFKVEQVRGLGSSRLEFLFRLYLPTSFFSFLSKIITGKYLNQYIARFLPAPWIEKRATDLVKDLEGSVRDPDDDDIFEYMIIATLEASDGKA